MKKINTILSTIIWLIAFIAILANVALTNEITRLKEENNRLIQERQEMEEKKNEI